MKHPYPCWRGWPGNRPAIIAEVGMNHGGNSQLAWEMISAAHASGADFVKLQSFRTEALLHPSLEYFQDTKEMELSQEAQEELFSRANESGISLVTTPFDVDSLAVAERFAPAFHKVASMDVDNVPLLESIAKTGRPVMVSCGLADLAEIETVVQTMQDANNDGLALLHCVSDYPASEDSLNLAMISLLRDTFRKPVGFSDHSIGLNGAMVAAAMGAVVIEKHFTTDRSLAESMPEADHELSIEPAELKALRAFCEAVPRVMGRAPRPVSDSMIAGRQSFRRGLYAKRKLSAGETLNLDNVSLVRPVAGIAAGAWKDVCDRKLVIDIEAGDPITYASVGL